MLRQINGFHGMASCLIGVFVCVHAYLGVGTFVCHNYALKSIAIIFYLFSVFSTACVCMLVCAYVLGENSQHGAGQGPRGGSGSGQSVAADPTVRGFSVSDGFSVPLSATKYRNSITVDQNISIMAHFIKKIKCIISNLYH